MLLDELSVDDESEVGNDEAAVLGKGSSFEAVESSGRVKFESDG